MTTDLSEPAIVRVLHGEGFGVRSTPFGAVGTVLDTESTEIAWVAKQGAGIDPDWLSQPGVVALCVLRGQLRVELARRPGPPTTLAPGDVLLLPPDTACRAYSWPRDSTSPTVFLTVSSRRPRGPAAAG